MGWLSIGLSVTIPAMLLMVIWWLRRSARKEGREEILQAGMKEEIEAQDAVHKTARDFRINPAWLERMQRHFDRK